MLQVNHINKPASSHLPDQHLQHTDDTLNLNLSEFLHKLGIVVNDLDPNARLNGWLVISYEIDPQFPNQLNASGGECRWLKFGIRKPIIPPPNKKNNICFSSKGWWPVWTCKFQPWLPSKEFPYKEPACWYLSYWTPIWALCHPCNHAW